MRGRLLVEVEAEVVDLLRDLIRIDTTNPPGNEDVAARFLAERLREDDLQCEIVESSYGRGNLIGRIKGRGKGPSLLLLSHLDVVPATPKEWSVDPFSGAVKDGYVWGRGAFDCKSLVAMEALVMKLLVRNRVKLKGDVLFAATADEERGGGAGVQWLVENHLSKIKADYVINEGGGFSFPAGDKHIFTVQTAEKGVIWMKIKARGRPGHGSMPGLADNAVLRMAEVALQLGTHRSKIRIVPTVKQFIENLSEMDPGIAFLLSNLPANTFSINKILDGMGEREKGLAELLRSMVRTTIAPTIIHGGIKENVIPSECEAVFDCRILPGQTKVQFLRDAKEILKGMDALEFSFVKADEPSESPLNTPLFTQIQRTLEDFSPNYSVTPFMQTGGTDSRFMRKMGSICYGFHPMETAVTMEEFLKMAHGIDERVSIKNLVFGVSVLYRLVRQFMT